MNKEALKLVKKCLDENSEELDLGNCGLTDEDFLKKDLWSKENELNHLLSQCTHIKKLIFSSSWEEPGFYTNYTKKYSRNRGKPNFFTTHPPAISKLNSLLCLVIGGAYDNHWRIQNTSFLDELQNLEILLLEYNDISTLIGFEKLTNLQVLYLGYNKLNSLRGIENLVNLKILSIRDNQITDLRILLEVRSYIESTLQLNFAYNPIRIPPPAVVSQGYEAIRDYLTQIAREKGETQYLFEAKLLVIGEGGAGKTSFIRKMQDIRASLPEEKDTTLGIDVTKWEYETQFLKIPGLNKVKFHVNLWDFGGQRIYQGTHQIFFSDKSLYVLLTDTREQKTDFSYWLNTVEQLGGDNSGMVIVLNKNLDMKFSLMKD